jgi:hypothetical protein
VRKACCRSDTLRPHAGACTESGVPSRSMLGVIAGTADGVST